MNVRMRNTPSPRLPAGLCAITTIVRNEAVMLPVWMRYYSRIVELHDLWVLDHESTMESTDSSIQALPAGVNVQKLDSGGKCT